jgi:hypothetical protein
MPEQVSDVGLGGTLVGDGRGVLERVAILGTAEVITCSASEAKAVLVQVGAFPEAVDGLDSSCTLVGAIWLQAKPGSSSRQEISSSLAVIRSRLPC